MRGGCVTPDQIVGMGLMSGIVNLLFLPSAFLDSFSVLVENV